MGVVLDPEEVIHRIDLLVADGTTLRTSLW
jgi:hypothetical protein